MTDEKIEQKALELYQEDGLTQKQIAERLRIGVGRVRQIHRKHGVKADKCRRFAASGGGGQW